MIKPLVPLPKDIALTRIVEELSKLNENMCLLIKELKIHR